MGLAMVVSKRGVSADRPIRHDMWRVEEIVLLTEQGTAHDIVAAVKAHDTVLVVMELAIAVDIEFVAS